MWKPSARRPSDKLDNLLIPGRHAPPRPGKSWFSGVPTPPVRGSASRVWQRRAFARHAISATALLALTVFGCRAKEPENAPHILERPGVYLDVPAARPRAFGERPPWATVIGIEAPVSEDAIDTYVRAFAEAVVAEDTIRLGRLLSDSVEEPLARTRGKYAVLQSYQSRFDRADYKQLAGPTLFGPWRKHDVPEPTFRGVDRGETDVVVTFSPVQSVVGGQRIFGDSIALLLRREGTELVARAIWDM